MDELIRRIKECELCSISKDTKNKSIGRGSKNPKYLFVGLNPGREENETGRPFDGPSGKMLDTWVEYLEIKPTEYAVVNLIKCYTPNESALKGDEAEKCGKFLGKQIEMLDPDYIIMLGAKPTQFLLDTKIGITKLAGRMFQRPTLGTYYIPLPHPSYYLRHGGQGWEEDLALVKRNITENITSMSHPSEIKGFSELNRITMEKVEEVPDEVNHILPQEYVPLHVHTTYSVTDSATKIRDLVKSAKEMGFDALAITDHGTVGGWLEFKQACEEYDMKSIYGIEFYIADDYTNKDTTRTHVVALAKDRDGIKNIFKLNDIAHREGFYYKPRILLEHLFEHGDGLVILSACTGGFISRHILEDNIEQAKELAQKFLDRFGKDFYLEVQPHDFEDQHKVNPNIIKMSKELAIPFVITTDSHYITKEDKKAHDAIKAISFRKMMGEAGFSIDTNFVMTTDELYDYAKKAKVDSGDVEMGMRATRAIANKCNAELERYNNALPRFEVEK